jgi:hypothetical protein
MLEADGGTQLRELGKEANSSVRPRRWRAVEAGGGGGNKKDDLVTFLTAVAMANRRRVHCRLALLAISLAGMSKTREYSLSQFRARRTKRSAFC